LYSYKINVHSETVHLCHCEERSDEAISLFPDKPTNRRVPGFCALSASSVCEAHPGFDTLFLLIYPPDCC